MSFWFALRTWLAKQICSATCAMTECYKADLTNKSLPSVIKAVSESAIQSHSNELKPRSRRTQIGVKISPSSEEESGRPLLSDHTKAFQVATSGAVAELVGFCQESALCSLSGRRAVKIGVLASYTSRYLAMVSIEKKALWGQFWPALFSDQYLTSFCFTAFVNKLSRWSQHLGPVNKCRWAMWLLTSILLGALLMWGMCWGVWSCMPVRIAL